MSWSAGSTEVQHGMNENDKYKYNDNTAHLKIALHKFASAGDVESIKSLMESNEGFDVNVSGKGKNTALHSALGHNQQGFVIDYLISKGANVNAFNTKGYNLLIMAVIYCQPGTQALEKLIEAGADWRTRFGRGKFSGLTLVDISVQSKNYEALGYLKRLQVLETNASSSNHNLPLTQQKNHGVCPVCLCTVKFPTKISFILNDQFEAEKKARENTNVSKGDHNSQEDKELYTCRKYMNELLDYSQGKAYKELCRIEYHGVGNKNKLRKEISESFSILHAVQECCLELGMPKPHTATPIHFENVFLIDLCSGKSLTTVLCGVLFPPELMTNNQFLGCDRLPLHLVPHLEHLTNTQYLSRDIMGKDFFKEISNEIREQTLQGRTTILVGMHLCGVLSERAISLFLNIPSIKALVLSPCCLPKLRKGVSRFDDYPKSEGEDMYVSWSKYLRWTIEMGLKESDAIAIRSYFDTHVHSIKNSIITATRR